MRPESPAAHIPRHGREWNAERCACGAILVGCHGCCELRCLTCDPYTDYERLNRCCTVVSSGADTPGGEQRRCHDEAVGAATPVARSRDQAKGYCPTCGQATTFDGHDKSGHTFYGRWLSFRDFEQILLSLGASGSDVSSNWPVECDGEVIA